MELTVKQAADVSEGTIRNWIKKDKIKARKKKGTNYETNPHHR